VTARLQSFTPESGSLVSQYEPIFVLLALDPGTTSRSLTMSVNGSPILTWTGGFVSLAPAYFGDVSASPTQLSATLVRDGGWAVGVSYSWSTAYSDSNGALPTVSGRLARTAYTLTRTPASDQSNVPPRAPVSLLVDFEAGLARAPALTLNGDETVNEDGELLTPAYSGRSGYAGLKGWSFVNHRRSFRRGARVRVDAGLVVSIGGLIYKARESWQFDVAETPASPRWTPPSLSPPAYAQSPVVAALRQVAASCLLTRGRSPALLTLLVDLALHSEVGQLLKPFVTGAGPQLLPEDLPPDAAIVDLVTKADPFWRAALQIAAPGEEREALERAWASEHPIERAAALAVILCYAEGLRNGH